MRVLGIFVLLAACGGSGATSGSGSASGSAVAMRVLRDKILSVNAHVVVTKNTTGFVEYRDVLAKVAKTRGVIAAEPIVLGESLIASEGGQPIGVVVKGVDPARVHGVLDLPPHVVAGAVDGLAENGILVGKTLAKTLAVKVGDDVVITMPGKSTRFRVRGVMFFDFDEYDRRLVVIGLAAAQALVEQGDTVTAIEAKVENIDGAPEAARAIESQLGGAPYSAHDWKELNRNLFGSAFDQRR